MDGFVVVVLVCLSLPVLHYISKYNLLGQRVAQLENQVSALRDAIEDLRHDVSISARQTPAPPAARPAPAEVESEMSTPRPEAAYIHSKPNPFITGDREIEIVDEGTLDDTAEPATVSALHSQPRAPSRLDRWIEELRSTEEWEAVVGTRWLNRIGALALILGVGFFLKYAFDQNWISPAFRVVIGLAIGAVLLAIAARAHGKGYAVFAQGLVGAGIATLYLSVYASWNFYTLVPGLVALAGMGIVTALAFAQALYYDSLAVSILAWIGGILAPLLLALQQPNEWGLFLYLIVLVTGILALTFRRIDWSVLEPMTLGATWLVVGLWYLNAYQTAHLLLTIAFVTVLWALFFALEIARVLKPSPITSRAGIALWISNGALYYGALALLINPQHHSVLGPATLGLGVVYLLALLTLRATRLAVADAARYAITAFGLLVLATALSFSDFSMVTLWSVEACAVLWLGMRLQLWYVWRPALTLYGLALTVLLITPGSLAYSPITRFRPLFNERVLAFLVLTAAMVISIPLVSRLKDRRAGDIVQSLYYASIATAFVLLTAETNDIFMHLLTTSRGTVALHLQFLRSLTIGVVWMAYSLGLTRLGFHRGIVPALVTGAASGVFALGLASVTGLTYMPIGDFVPVLNIRTAAFVLLIAGLGIEVRWWSRAKDLPRWALPVPLVLGGLILLAGFELITAETNDTFQHLTGHSALRAGNGRDFLETVTLAMEWTLFSMLPVWLGIKRKTLPLLLAGLSLTSLATVTVALGGGVWGPLSSQAGLFLSTRPLAFIFVAAAIFLQLHWLRRSEDSYAWMATGIIAAQAALVMLGFELIGTEIRDYFATTGNAVSGSHDLEQLLLSIFWLVYAIVLIVIGIWRRARWVRMGAMAMFVFSILKIFTYDLGFLPPAYRSISLAGLGVILLGVSFLYQRYRGLLLDPR